MRKPPQVARLKELIEPLPARTPLNQGDAQAALAQSREHFRSFLAAHPDGYAYLRSYSEGPDRIKNDFVHVRAARVIEHRCSEWRHPKEWGSETTRSIAEPASCHQPATIEQLYERCADFIARSASGVVLEIHDNGSLPCARYRTRAVAPPRPTA